MDYRTIFPKRHTLLPVIHCTDTGQAVRNAHHAVNAGADGVWLINHDIHFGQLLKCYDIVRQGFPNLWIGINALDLEASNAFQKLPEGAQGLWTDDIGYCEGDPDPAELPRQLAAARSGSPDWKGLFFGGVCFKYVKPEVQDVRKCVTVLSPLVDVITTSGPGTGHQPTVLKIKEIREAAGPDKPLAIASGITPENVGKFMPYADCFLVASGISDSHTELNESKIAALVAAMK